MSRHSPEPLRLHLYRAAATVAAFFSFNSLAAEPSANPGDDDEPVVVTATRVTARVSSVLSDVSIIDREAIERSPAATLPELLSTLPGIGITQSGGAGAGTSLIIRGANANHSLVLINGQRLSSATAGTTAIEHIPLAQIERIEVLRGPASGLYGADAIGGVIQIFTRTPSGPPKAFGELGFGGYGTTIGSAGFGGDVADTRFSLVTSGEHSQGFNSTRAATGTFSDIFNADRDGYDNRSISAQATRQLNAGGRIGADLLRVHSRKHFDTANCDVFFIACTADFDNFQDQTQTSLSTYATAHPAADWKTELRLGRSRDEHRSNRIDPLTSIISVDHYETTQDQASWQNELASRIGTFMVALDWRKESVSSTQPFDVAHRSTSALALGYQGRAGKHNLQASGRVDDMYALGLQRSGSLAYGYHIARPWRIHASLGRAFHAPTFNDLYWPVDPINFYQGNPNLKPERSFNRELGVKYSDDHLLASLTLFRNEVSDLLNYVPNFAPPFTGQMENLASTTLKGASLTASYLSGPWQFKGGYDVLSARDDATQLRLQRRVPRSGNVVLRRQGDGIDAGLQVVANGSRFNDSANTQRLAGYAIVNADLTHRLSPDWSVHAKLNNLFDRDYVVIRDSFALTDFSVPGRSLFVSARYQPK